MGNELFNAQLIGTIGAVLTTICWAPQAWRVIRYRNTHAISLLTNATLFAGQICWLVYGLALNDWPLIGSNAISIMFTIVILTMKVRYG
jgi:MtN3 and saliva related transmembrane protein